MGGLAVQGPLIFGRERELARLAAMLDRARAGTSGAVVVRGEPGVGRTALLREFERRAEPCTVLSATGIGSESEVPFASLAELLLPLRDHLDELTPFHAEVLAGALALGPPVRTSPFAVGVATLSLLAAAAEDDGPVVVLVDDAQWVDSESERALGFAVRRLRAEAILAVFAIRSDVPFLDVAEELQLTGLDADAGRQLVEGHRGVPVAPEVAEELHRETGGNPLALVAAADLLHPEQLSGRRPLDQPLPLGSRLSEGVGAQLVDLDEATRRALLVVAASHSGSYRAVHAALEELGLGEEQLAQAEARGLIHLGGPTIRFTHAVLRSAVYHAAVPADRRAAHAALAHLGPGLTSPEERAWHVAAAAVGPDEQVAAEMDAAADQMLERSAYSAASIAYERAAELSTDERRRTERLLEAIKAAQVVGRTDRALRLLDGALPRIDAPDLRAQVSLLRSFVGVRAGDTEPAFRTLQHEAQRIEAVLPGVAAAMLSQAAMQAPVAGQTRLGLELAEHAYELSPDPGTVAALGAMRMYAGQEREARDLLLGAAPHLGGIDIQAPEHVIGIFAALSLAWMYEHEAALRLTDPVIASARDTIAPGVLPLPLLARAEVDLRRGDWTAARAGAQEARRLAEELGQVALLPFADAVLAAQEALRGAQGACERHCGQSLQAAGEVGISGIEMFTSAALGMAALGAGRVNDAIGHLEGVRSAAERLEIPSVVIAPWRENLIEAYVRDGRRRDATELLAEFEDRAGKADNAHVWAVVRRCRALCDPGAADQALSEAMEWHAKAAVPFERARTQLHTGEHLRRTRRRGDARHHLRAALRTFEDLGARHWTERAAASLRATGGVVRPREHPVSQNLTPQELQVALAVAEGATNKEVAAALFLSPKTVEYHLGNVYRKLEVRSRTELARRLSGRDEPAV